MGHRTHVTVCMQRGARMELYFRRDTLRPAPEVIQRCTRSLWVDTEHRASKDTVKGHHKKRIKCGCFFWMFFFFPFLCMVICLDMWMHNLELS